MASVDFGSEPCVIECHTKRATDKFSQCLANNAQCKYSLPSGNDISYCVHPDHKDFQRPLF